MSRRDTIIVAVLINAGLLAILFVTAINVDTPTKYQFDQQTEYDLYASNGQREASRADTSAAETAGSLTEHQTTTPAATPRATTEEVLSVATSVPNEIPLEWVEVMVKRGDFLEGIARANGVTVKEIMDANDLSSPHLRVGQILHVPVKDGTVVAAAISDEVTPTATEDFDQHQYYIIQSGDNPWLIARKD